MGKGAVLTVSKFEVDYRMCLPRPTANFCPQPDISVPNFKNTFRIRVSRWRNIAGLDFHVLVTLLFRGWAVVAGGATMFLLPLWLSPIEQGYYFTFGSVLALQIFFELGLNQIIMQLVSHEVAHLSETPDGRLTGKESHLDRLSSLARMISLWYGVAALLFSLIVGIAGAVFFTQNAAESMCVWLGMWLALVTATAANLWLSPGLAVMEGCGKVGQVARLRLVQSVLGYAVLWITLLSGAGLWAATAIPTVSAVCTAYWLKTEGNMLRWLSNRAVAVNNKLRWRTDVLPLQWRIALSWASGYLIFNLFTPTAFSRFGAIEAGKLGIALTIFSAISSIGMSWVNAKAPNFTRHIALGKRQELNSLFKSLFIRSILFITLISLCFLILAWFLNYLQFSMMLRVASLDIILMLMLATIINSIVFALALYMRAHREEPMLIQSVLFGLLMIPVVYIGSETSIFVMIFIYVLMLAFISLPWTIWLFLKYYKRIK
jgi:hypothetical protein